MTLTQSDKDIVEHHVKQFYSGGKGKQCEVCRMRGIKRRAYDVRKIGGIEYYLCWNCCCCIDEEVKRAR